MLLLRIDDGRSQPDAKPSYNALPVRLHRGCNRVGPATMGALIVPHKAKLSLTTVRI